MTLHHGKGRAATSEEFGRMLAGADVVLTSFNLLQRDEDLVTSCVFEGAMVLDEAQNIKNPTTRQSRVARTLKGNFRRALTGTPQEIDAESGMFPESRLKLMQGSHHFDEYSKEGSVYAFLIDVAGEDEGLKDDLGSLANPGRDATALTIVEVDLMTVNDPLIKAPTYKVIWRPRIGLEGSIPIYTQLSGGCSINGYRGLLL